MEFQAPWASILEYPSGNGAALALEAHKEIGAEHPLAGAVLETIARRADCDDVLFEVNGGPIVAVVHLTWSGSRETDGFPRVELFPDYAQFAHERMSRDKDQFDGLSK